VHETLRRDFPKYSQVNQPLLLTSHFDNIIFADVSRQNGSVESRGRGSWSRRPSAPLLVAVTQNVPGRFFPVTCFDDCEIGLASGLRAVGAMPVQRADLLGCLLDTPVRYQGVRCTRSGEFRVWGERLVSGGRNFSEQAPGWLPVSRAAPGARGLPFHHISDAISARGRDHGSSGASWHPLVSAKTKVSVIIAMSWSFRCDRASQECAGSS
jgi:hypothetical protein